MLMARQRVMGGEAGIESRTSTYRHDDGAADDEDWLEVHHDRRISGWL